MESPRENNDGPNTLQVNTHDRKGARRHAKWSAEFNCLIVNGILTPIPLSARRMETVAKDEVETGKVDRHHVIVSETNGKWKVEIYNLGPGDHVVVPVVTDHSPIFTKKYQLSLEERLVGWTVEKRKRGNGKEDKFYYHYTRQFRSFGEMATYILYSCKVKDLQMITNTIRQEVHDVEAAEAMMKMSSTDASESGSGHSADDQ